MIRSAFWNGIDFSGNFNRENSLFNFEAQRVKNVIPHGEFGKLCFFTNDDEFARVEITDLTNGGVTSVGGTSIVYDFNFGNHSSFLIKNAFFTINKNKNNKITEIIEPSIP